MRQPALALIAAFTLAGCARPAPASYVSGGPASTAAGSPAGINAVGESCTAQPVGKGVDLYCGAWQEPSARVAEVGPQPATSLADLATVSSWRAGLDSRFTCAAPVATTLPGGDPALLMQCSRRVGGWPHVALVATAQGRNWTADGVLSAFPVIERAVDALAAGRPIGTASAGGEAGSGADAMMASRLAARAISSGDVGEYEHLMAAGTRANLAESPVAAERAFRAALALQRRALGADNPNTVDPMLPLAVQLSNQGRYSEADALFRRAAVLAPGSADRAATARLRHYQGLDQLNRGHLEAALADFREAEAGYARLVPPQVLVAREGRASLLRTGFARQQDLMPEQDMLIDPIVQAALLGVIETRRYQAVTLRLQGHLPESAAMLAEATALARSNDVLQPIVASRLYRTGGMIAVAEGSSTDAVTRLTSSSAQFSQALPGSRSIARTALLHAAVLVGQGRHAAALPVCRGAVQLLTQLATGIDADLIAPCLDAYAGEAGAVAGTPAAQALLGEMFVAAQLGQSDITSQQIAQASVRLAENTRSPEVAAAIRRRQDSTAALAALYRQRDQLGHDDPDAPPVLNQPTAAALDTSIANAETAVAEADASLQEASPRYGQLVQKVVAADAVEQILRPGEAFVSVALSSGGGWSFLLRGQAITAARIDGGRPRVASLVQAIRASVTEDDHGALPPFDIADAAALYTALFGGLGGGLDGAASLTVAPTGPLLALPFSVLLTGPADPAALGAAPWLIRRMPISHVPAPSNFVSLRRLAGGSRATGAWFGMGDFVPPTLAQAKQIFPGPGCAQSAALFAGLPALPYAGRELEAARALLGGSPADELLGAAYTTPAVLRAGLKRYRVLHFAAHALLPSELKCASEPAIVTSVSTAASGSGVSTAASGSGVSTAASGSGASGRSAAPSGVGALLTASDVTGLDLDADLVVLSACNSGGPGGSGPGGATGGESLSGLARAFFYAGARSMMVTHWSVNDQTSAFLVASTLSRMRPSASPDAASPDIAAALRDAELKILADAGKSMPAALSHPFYWAPFALIGEGHGRLVTASN